ncbi:MAG: formate dehydrogenase delta subunit [Caulobacteraceae bacterium]|nr:formate dehydrogenase delta subunit [Caulobacteraceae bacterium]
MDARRLTAMANQIGAFFRAQGEAAAVAGVEDHLRRFWDPRMRREIVAHLNAGGEGLTPAVRAAVARLAFGSGGMK